MAGKPSGNLLIRDDLGIQMTAEAQGHHEDPGLERPAGEGIGNVRPLAEIHLSRFAGGKIQDAGRLGLMELQTLNQPADRGVASRKSELVRQGLVYRRHTDVPLNPLANLLLIRTTQRLMGRIVVMMFLFKRLYQDLVVGKRQPFVKPPLLPGNGPNLPTFYPAHQPCPGDGPVAFSHAHTMNHLTIFVHLEPPVAHVSSSQRDMTESILKLLTWSETLFNPFYEDPPPGRVAPLRRSPTGSIAPIMNWSHYGDHQVASLRRSRLGPIAPIIYNPALILRVRLPSHEHRVIRIVIFAYY